MARDVDFAPLPNRCVLCAQGGAKAARLSAEGQRWRNARNAAAGKDPARGCRGNPVPPGCPRRVGQGRAPPGAAPDPAGLLADMCRFLQLQIKLLEKLGVRFFLSEGFSLSF